MELPIFLGGAGLVSGPFDSNSEPWMEGVQQALQPTAQTFQAGLSLGQQLMIAGITTLLGFIVYVMGQFLTKFVIETILDQRKVIGEIADALIFYANKYRNLWDGETFVPWEKEDVLQEKREEYQLEKEKLDEISDTIRRLGSVLVAKTHAIPFYRFWATLHFVRPMKNIIAAKKSLIGLSNYVDMADKDGLIRYEGEIRSALGIFNPDEV